MQAEVIKYRREKRSKLLFQTGQALTIITAVMIAAASALPLGQDLAVQTQCSTSGCQATAPVFTPQIQCPGIAGKTCTYHIQVSAQVSVTPNDFGQYRLLVDGAPPVQFQTDFQGYFNWEQQNPNSGVGIWEARPYAVVGTVTNDITNQNHAVEVDIACFDTDGNGCTGAFGFGDLRVDVFQP